MKEIKRKKERKNAQSTKEISQISQKFWENIISLCLQVKNGDLTWKDVSYFAEDHGVSMSPDYIRQGCRILFAAIDGGLTLSMSEASDKLSQGLSEASQKIPQSAEIKKDGTSNRDYLVDQDRLEKLFDEGDLSEKKVRQFFGIPDTLEITAMKYQIWHSAVKGGGKQMLYNIKVNLKPKGAEDIKPEDFALFFKENNEKFISLPVEELPPVPEGATFLEVDFADPHFGLLAHQPETGEHYDLKIAKERMLMCASSVVNRNKGRQFKCINIVTLGDIIHVDNGDMTTTKGTKQDAEGRVPKMLDTAVYTLVEVINILKKGLKSPITYTYVPGNHDTNLGYAVAMTVKAIFRNDPNVTFDIAPTLFKTVTYGCTIVGLSHGEANDKRAHTDLINQHRREFGLSDYAEVHMGHLHSESAKDVDGIKIRRVPAICASSYWEKSQGYAAVNRGIMTFEYDEYEGLVANGYHDIKGIAAGIAARSTKHKH